VYSQPYLWTVLLPQATWHQPAVKHSIIALANLHQSLTSTATIPASTSTGVATHHSSFIGHYNKAIRALVTDKPPIDVVLTSCVIFWALENFNGSGQAAAFDHMKAAVKILGEWKAKRRPDDPAHDLISTYIEPTIKDGIKFASVARVEEELLQSQIAALSLSPQDMRVMNIDLPAFTTLETAGEYLGNCISQVLNLLSIVETTFDSDDVVESIHALDARLHKWMNLFQNLTATGPVHQRRMLVVHNVAAYILLDRLKEATAGLVLVEESDPPRRRYSFVVLEVEDMMLVKQDSGDDRAPATATVDTSFGAGSSSSSRSNSAVTTTTTTNDLGFIPPMFLVASSASRVETRRRAINALRLLNLTEGPWNTELAARIAEAMLDIVHQFSTPPAEVELRHMNFAFDGEEKVLYMNWEPEYEQFQGVDFFREIEVDVDSADTVSTCTLGVMRFVHGILLKTSKTNSLSSRTCLR
jgi:hypothetical protein